MAAVIFLIFLLSIPFWGYVILLSDKINSNFIAWILAIIFILVIYFFIPAEALLKMFLYIVSSFLTLKIVVAKNHLNNNQLNFSQWLVFCYTWFGMNPKPFAAFPSKALPDFPGYFIKGASRIIVGLLVINIAGLIDNYHSISWLVCLQHLCYLVGLSLVLHFGLLNISTAFLRMQGINVTSLFKDPIKSKSLNEFWSRRWNLAFVELTSIAVHRPVKSKYGNKIGFWASFIFSGLLHEMAISLPVNSGFGKPFSYFILQAALILTIDPFISKQSNRFIRTSLILACLFLPIFLLFHEQFIRQVIIPLVSYLKII